MEKRKFGFIQCSLCKVTFSTPDFSNHVSKEHQYELANDESYQRAVVLISKKMLKRKMINNYGGGLTTTKELEDEIHRLYNKINDLELHMCETNLMHLEYKRVIRLMDCEIKRLNKLVDFYKIKSTDTQDIENHEPEFTVEISESKDEINFNRNININIYFCGKYDSEAVSKDCIYRMIQKSLASISKEDIDGVIKIQPKNQPNTKFVFNRHGDVSVEQE